MPLAELRLPVWEWLRHSLLCSLLALHLQRPSQFPLLALSWREAQRQDANGLPLQCSGWCTHVWPDYHQRHQDAIRSTRKGNIQVLALRIQRCRGQAQKNQVHRGCPRWWYLVQPKCVEQVWPEYQSWRCIASQWEKVDESWTSSSPWKCNRH